MMISHPNISAVRECLADHESLKEAMEAAVTREIIPEFDERDRVFSHIERTEAGGFTIVKDVDSPSPKTKLEFLSWASIGRDTILRAEELAMEVYRPRSRGAPCRIRWRVGEFTDPPLRSKIKHTADASAAGWLRPTPTFAPVGSQYSRGSQIDIIAEMDQTQGELRLFRARVGAHEGYVALPSDRSDIIIVGRTPTIELRNMGFAVEIGVETVTLVIATRIATGFAALDSIFGGGLHPSSLTTVIGRPGVGKTRFLISVLGNMARDGWRCLFATVSESRERLIRLAIEMGVQHERLLFENTSTVKPEDVRRGGVDVVVIDDANVSDASESRSQFVARLHDLPRRANCVTIASAVVVRNGTTQRDLLHGSDAVVVLGKREFEPTAEVTKTRHGAVGEVLLRMRQNGRLDEYSVLRAVEQV